MLQVVEDGYEFFADRQLVTIFSAPNYCGEFDNAGAMMSVDESLLCSFQILKPEKKKFFMWEKTTKKSKAELQINGQLSFFPKLLGIKAVKKQIESENPMLEKITFLQNVVIILEEYLK